MSSTNSAEDHVQTVSPPKKRPKRKYLSKMEKHMILNTYKSETETNANVLISDIVSKVAYTTGTSDSSVYRVIREYKTTHELHSPKKTKRRETIIDKIDDFDRNAIRKKVHEFYFRNELPTIDKVLKVVNEDDDLPNFSRSSLYRLLKHLNFKYVKRGRDSTLIDRDDIIIWRRQFLETINKMRQEGRKIYFTDETWLNAGHTKNKLWKDITVKSRKEAFLSGLSTGNKAPSGKGSRLIITHIGSETGFVDGGLWMFESKKGGDYHEAMDGKHFETWFEKVLPLLDENAVIVLDNARYHSRKKDKVPNESWSKGNIQKWLTSKGVMYEDHFLKKQLLVKVKEVSSNYNLYVIDELAKSQNKTVLRLPPYHCELNPIEMIWAQIKCSVASRNTTFKIADVKELCLQAIKNIGEEEWKKCVSHVKDKTEKEMWELDSVIENAVEPLIININGTGSDKSSFDTSDSDDN